MYHPRRGRNIGVEFFVLCLQGSYAVLVARPVLLVFSGLLHGLLRCCLVCLGLGDGLGVELVGILEIPEPPRGIAEATKGRAVLRSQLQDCSEIQQRLIMLLRLQKELPSRQQGFLEGGILKQTSCEVPHSRVVLPLAQIAQRSQDIHITVVVRLVGDHPGKICQRLVVVSQDQEAVAPGHSGLQIVPIQGEGYGEMVHPRLVVPGPHPLLARLQGLIKLLRGLSGAGTGALG
mmetsp:Transcript_123697/g.283598  ORF Transcript_123697/g.283598 Transcript_123697/m.283598 type:complete len:233 (-) Transcript_123697:71-769(-)